jgi:parallel beta-helix repeat protein
MKMIIKPMYLVFFLMISMMSCNNEELFIEPVAEVVIEVPEGIPADDTEPLVNTTVPCDFTLDTVQANATVIINCIMDLGGQTITLPAGVTLVYEGGDIVNGILNFSDGSVISGELLNASLTLGGSKPQIKDPIFNFDPKRWGIVEGEVPQSVADKNSEIINQTIIKVKDLGINTFSIDKLDAYFYQALSYEYILLLPSDFHLKMTDNTHLRVFPNNHPNKGNLIRIVNKENVTVTGGNLHGDRDAHDYSSGGTHEQGHLIVIKTGVNVKIENVHMSMAIGDGLDVESYLHHTDPQYVGSHNVLITGCTFDSNRRNNLSITDGHDIIVENCTFLNAGVSTPNSTGTAPRCAIDIEPYLTQRVDRVTIRNNTESGSAEAALVVADGDDILVTGNSFEKGVGISWATNVKIINNPKLQQVGAGREDVLDNRHYEVSGNTISNPTGSGILAINPGVQIFNNNIIDCKLGIQIVNLKDANIYNNTITSKEEIQGDGINARGGGDNVLIKENVIDVYRSFLFQGAGKFIITNNTIDSSILGSFEYCNNFSIINNNFNKGGIRLDGSTNVIVQNNNFKQNDAGINLRNESTNNIQILNNYFEKVTGNGFAIYGEGNKSWGNRNITINDNEFNKAGIYSIDYDGFTVKNNIGSGDFLYFRGNNSYFERNRGLQGEIL